MGNDADVSDFGQVYSKSMDEWDGLIFTFLSVGNQYAFFARAHFGLLEGMPACKVPQREERALFIQILRQHVF
jgi:hypothetical protein